MLLGASHFFSQFTLRLRGGCWLHSYHAHSNIWLLSLFHFHLGIFLHVHTRRSTRTSPVSPFSIVDAQLTSTINRMLLQRCTPSIVFGNLKTHIVGLPLFLRLITTLRANISPRPLSWFQHANSFKFMSTPSIT